MDNVPQRQGPGIDARFSRLNSLRSLCCRSPSLALSLALSLSLSLSLLLLLRLLAISFFAFQLEVLSGLGYKVSYNKALHLVLCICVFFFFFPCLKSWVRLFGWGWFFFVVDVCGRFVSVVLVELLWRGNAWGGEGGEGGEVGGGGGGTSSYVYCLHWVLLSRFWGGFLWTNSLMDGGVKLQACVCFSYRFGSVAEIRGGEASQWMIMFERFAGFTREFAERIYRVSVAMELVLLREEEEEEG